MSQLKYLLIANPVSGPKDHCKGLLKKVVARIEKVSPSVTLKTTEREGHGYEMAREALKSDYDVIVAIGGDGTVNEVARALVGSDKTLGIIPNGSGNGLARELQIPMGAEDAIEVLLKHQVTTIDTCKVNGEPFFVTCGIGFDGKITKEFQNSDTRGITTYAKEAISEYFDYTPRDYHIMVDDKEVTATALLVAVGNASQYGNNAFIAPNASMTDGLLNLTILKPFPHIEAVKVVTQLFTKGLDKSQYTSLYQGRHLVIEATTPVNYHLDGEARKKTQKLDVEVIPNSLHVVKGSKRESANMVLDFFHSISESFSQLTSDIIDKLK